MIKKDVLVDTVFLNKLSEHGKDINTFKKILDELSFCPVVHPYIAENELDMFPYFHNLVKEGYIKIIDYSEFLSDEEDKEYYADNFIEIHDEIRRYLEANGGKKQLEKLCLPKRQTIFTYRKAGMSLGDVHMILMAFFLQIPIILTEDSDIELLRSITKRKMAREGYQLEILNSVDVMISIAIKKESSFSKKELEKLVKRIGDREHLSKVKTAWNSVHNDL
ncbi:MAG: hypothetical protein E7266_09865 [Lachnospiraceae bacterium]|nr:hypothetical protein [Lachnospiraceae bacterium]